MSGLAGVTAIDISPAGETVSVVAPVTPAIVASIVVLPEARAVASPVALIDATVVFEEAQTTESVRLAVEPSVYVPVAVNCSVSPAARFGLAGLTAIDDTAAGATVSVVVPLTLPSVAVMVDEPVVIVVARPPVEIVATEVVADAQTTDPRGVPPYRR